MPFEQAKIQIEKQEEFARLQWMIERVFAAGAVERFLKALVSSGVPIRDFERVLDKGLLEKVDGSRERARSLYGSLPLSDQAQMRELYLTRLEEVDATLRGKYNRVYRYY